MCHRSPHEPATYTHTNETRCAQDDKALRETKRWPVSLPPSWFTACLIAATCAWPSRRETVYQWTPDLTYVRQNIIQRTQASECVLYADK